MADSPDNDHVWHDLLLDAVVAAVAALDLGRGAETRVVKWKTADVAGTVGPLRPLVVVSIDESRETCGPFSTEEDERVLPILVTYLDRADRKKSGDADPQGLKAWLAVRQKLTNAFLMRLFAGVAACWDVEVRPLDVLELERLKGPGLEDAAGSLLIACRVITARVRPA